MRLAKEIASEWINKYITDPEVNLTEEIAELLEADRREVREEALREAMAECDKDRPMTLHGYVDPASARILKATIEQLIAKGPTL